MHYISIFLPQRIAYLLALTVLFFGCGSDNEEPIDCSSANLQASIGTVSDATCGLENGSFQLAISGGNAPFELTIPGLGSQSLPSNANLVENIPGGNHTIIVTDVNNCDFSTNITVNDVNDVAIETQIEASGCQTANGTIAVSASGGKEPYMYSLDGGAMQTDNIFTELAVGDYTALVTDGDGCQTSVTVSLLSGVSYNENIIPIINANCAISGCHDGSSAALPDWTDLTTVQANAADIKTRTSEGTMPPAGRPDLKVEEIQAIACWVDDGALNN